jgi:hypothetical protein
MDDDLHLEFCTQPNQMRGETSTVYFSGSHYGKVCVWWGVDKSRKKITQDAGPRR